MDRDMPTPPPIQNNPKPEPERRWSILDCDVPFEKALRWTLVVVVTNALIMLACFGIGFLVAAIIDPR